MSSDEIPWPGGLQALHSANEDSITWLRKLSMLEEEEEDVTVSRCSLKTFLFQTLPCPQKL